MKKKIYGYALLGGLIFQSSVTQAMEDTDAQEVSYPLATLAGTPAEVRQIICHQLPQTDLLNLSLTCHLFHDQVAGGTQIIPSFTKGFEFVEQDKVEDFRNYMRTAQEGFNLYNIDSLPFKNPFKKNSIENQEKSPQKEEVASAFYQLALLAKQKACRWNSEDFFTQAILYSLRLGNKETIPLMEGLLSQASFTTKAPLENKGAILVHNYKGEPLCIPEEITSSFTEQTNIAASSYQEFLDPSQKSPFSLPTQGDSFSELGDLSLERLGDFKEAFHCMIMATYLGDSTGFYRLALILRQGQWSPHIKTFPLLPRVTHLDFRMIKYLLGDCYQTRKNYFKAFQWYQKSAKEGFGLAQYKIGVMYTQGEGVEKNQKKGAKWFFKEARQDLDSPSRKILQTEADTNNNRHAQYQLGKIYMIDFTLSKKKVINTKYSGIPKTPSYRSLHYFRQAAVQGHGKALKELEEMALCDLPEAQYQLGMMYNRGEGVEEDKETAINWLTKAAQEGHLASQHDLGVLYARSEGVKNKEEEGVNLICQAMNRGHLDAFKRLKGIAREGNQWAQYKLGQMYTYGEGTEKNQKKGAKWLFKIARQDLDSPSRKILQTEADTNNNRHAQYQLGKIESLRDEKNSQVLPLSACRYFAKAANEGHEKALEALAKAANQGHWKALEDLEEMALRGFLEAQYHLGMMYNRGEGVEEDKETAIHWLMKAAQENHLASQHDLGVFYARGEGVKNKEKEGVDLICRAMDRGHSHAFKTLEDIAREGNQWAQYKLGQMYAYGEGVKESPRKALDFYKKAAEQSHLESLKELKKIAWMGSEKAQHVLGNMYFHGKGSLKVNEKEARKWYEKAAKLGHRKSLLKLEEIAKMDSKEAQYALGEIYLKRVFLNHKKAKEWYEKAAKLGHPGAQDRLGWMYWHGLGGAKDSKKALKYCKKSMKQGYKEGVDHYNEILQRWTPQISYEMAQMFEKGEGREKDENKAKVWYKKAAEENHFLAIETLAEAGEAEYQFLLANTYINDHHNYEKAKEWLLRAAEKGHSKAQYQVGQSYEKGSHGFEEDQEMADDWYKKAAEENHFLAIETLAEAGEAEYQFLLANTYINDHHNYEKAKEWLLRAAEKGHSKAQYQVGQSYEKGSHGFEEDQEMADDWYKKAADQGHEEARSALSLLSRISGDAHRSFSFFQNSSLFDF